MKPLSLCSRILFTAAALLFAIAVAEKVVNAAGYTLIGQAYAPGRLLEFAGIMVLFVIGLLLREIRDLSRTRG